MVWVICFLTITNIALGYGLAIYVERHFGKLVWHRAKTLPRSESNLTDTLPVVTKAVEAATTSATPVSMETPADPTLANSEAVEVMATSNGEATASETVDEENVLAGIEEFRSQLAKISTTGEPVAAELEEKPELATAN
jgi:hypothetical protein